MKKKKSVRPKISASGKSKELDHIIIKGAREHNLKNIHVELPKKKLIVFTGVSGSGKSSLAFDTIFAEGQRRYVESLSAYARQFIGQMEKPKYDTIRGLSPTISIEQKSASKNPRSTVGTITEIYDYLRVLFARAGIQYCHKCGKKVGRGDASSMVDQIITIPQSTRIILLAPIIENRKGEHRELFEKLKSDGFARVRIDGVVHNLSDVQSLSKHKKHNIEVIVDRLIIKKGTIKMSEARTCCGIAFPELAPSLFSFNSPRGMCPSCNGIGTVLSMDENKIIPDGKLTIREGAVIPWRNYFTKENSLKNGGWGFQQLKAVGKRWGINFDIPWKKLPKKHRDICLFGSQGEEITVNWNSSKIKGEVTTNFEGLLNSMMRRYMQTSSESAKSWYSKFLTETVCSLCNGSRLKTEALHVKIENHSIIDITAMTIKNAHDFFKSLTLTGNRKMIAGELLKEISGRLGFLINVGLNYLSLDRKGPTLSGGESQRIRLASQVGSELTGVLYILDEPSIGLHQKDNIKLLKTLCHLRDIGNTLIVVEHDRETIESADWVLDIGPGAGHLGGRIVAAGTPRQIMKSPGSITGKYLSGKEKTEVPGKRKTPKASGNKWISIQKASENNLTDITVRIPVGLLVSITGVSGAGKSTLINQILYPALARKLHASTLTIGKHKSIKGLSNIDKVINIDQKAIGRTPRSNPATYTKVFDHIRELFALLPESRARGYKKGRFSFNVKGGRCEFCSGDGYNRVEMHFLADVFVPCEVCKRKRFNRQTLEILYKSHSIADILEMSVAQAMELFSNHPKIITILNTLMQVGLSYIKLGQAATTLSGGEAQRIKLARELSKRDTGRTLYILDEPTTGLHFDDIRLLLAVLKQLVNSGNTVVVIEHNLDVIKTADWIIDLGPDGGDQGGSIVAQGSPEKVASSPASYTGQFLKKILTAL
ncbi:MAG: excinuclease ABC subunit UvrA [Deltaproteobacteria bacterium]|nr:excinuclease ABC subunit UvrA [Deltaproteobacteria bacterium]